MTPRLLPRQEAAAYLGMSARSFDDMVVGHVPVVQIGSSSRGYRYDRSDLDGWVDSQPKMVVADACGAKESKSCESPKGSYSETASGISRRRSMSDGSNDAFGKLLAAKRQTSKKQQAA